MAGRVVGEVAGGALIGDIEFVGFWAAERDRLCRVLAVSLGDAVLAAEAVDEAMARALQRWSTVSGYEDPAGWVLHVARNWARSWRRKLSRRPTVPREQLDVPVEPALPDVDVIQVLAGLPEAQRIVVALRFGLDWELARIASALQVPEGTVKSRLHRGLVALGEQEEALR